MAKVSLSLVDLYKEAFGMRPEAFKPNFPKTHGEVDGMRTGSGMGGSPYYEDGINGRVFMPVTISFEDDGQMAFGGAGSNSNAGQKPNKSWLLPNPMVSIESRKHIIDTALTERRGTVKEMINTSDYEIMIRGLIVGSTHDFPEDQVAMLRDAYEQNKPVSIASAVTDIFLLRPDRSGSDKVVIAEMRLPVIRGVKNVRPYELKLISDETFNLISIE
ncbi:MAG: hypothetical protein IAE95_07340 [Chitinophagaceae bacterium]|nr:hypothetical protein [Chitinophagaceae bacterium]